MHTHTTSFWILPPLPYPISLSHHRVQAAGLPLVKPYLLCIYFTHGSVYILILLSIHPTLSFTHCVDKSILYICITIKLFVYKCFAHFIYIYISQIFSPHNATCLSILLGIFFWWANFYAFMIYILTNFMTVTGFCVRNQFVYSKVMKIFLYSILESYMKTFNFYPLRIMVFLKLIIVYGMKQGSKFTLISLFPLNI